MPDTDYFSLAELTQADIEYITLSVCEHHDFEEMKSVKSLTEVVSDYGFCGVCGSNRRELPNEITASVVLKEEFHPDAQELCRSGCSHYNCGNYSTYNYHVLEVINVVIPEPWTGPAVDWKNPEREGQ